MVLVMFLGGWGGWAIYWSLPFWENVPTCGVNVQILASGTDEVNTLEHGANLDLIMGTNRMMIRGRYSSAGKIFNVNRIINFSESIHYPHSRVTVSSVQKQEDDSLGADDHFGLGLAKGDKFDLRYKRTFAGRYLAYLDSFKLGECKMVFR